jgi:transposase
MPTPRIAMRQIREVLRLHLQAKLSYAEVGRALRIPKSTAGAMVLMARAAGVDWATAQQLDDAELERRLYRPPVPRCSKQLEPDYGHIHQELKRPGVTLQLLWEEYSRSNALAYKYTSFCIKYRAWVAAQARSMRQVHVAGERGFIDYAGQTVPIVDASTGEISQAQIFVAALGASSYTFACATARQTAADWLSATADAYEFFGGVPRLTVPDQTRALIARPDRYEPQASRTVEEFAAHYGTVFLPARPGHPRDKPKVEAAVLLVERWILARLRNRRFFSLDELNAAIAALLVELNNRPFKKLPGCRRSAFESLDQPALQPLPATRFELCRWKAARVNIDYHVEYDERYYSVPHRFVHAEVELRVSATAIEVLLRSQRIATHLLVAKRWGYSTLPEHMPASHRAHREWTPSRLIAWGDRIGAATGRVVRWQMESRPHPEQGYRSCLGLLRLSRQYPHERLEAACARALSIGAPTTHSVGSILKNGLDRQPLAKTDARASTPSHDNVRGPDYYH